MILPLLAGGHAIAQIQRSDADRETRRIDRRVDDLQKAFDNLQKGLDGLNLDMEKRLTKIETLMQIGVGALSLISAAVVGQICMGVANKLRAVRLTPDKGEGP